MGGMGSLYVGVSGLQTSQNALNTTAHNLANINTPGYVRQQVVQKDLLYDTIRYGALGKHQVGIGAGIAQVRQVRDMFLDKSYRLNSGRQGFYETGYAAYYELETLLGKLEGDEFKDTMLGLKDALNEIAKAPDDSTNLTLLKKNATKFIEDAQNIYESLKEYQQQLNDQVSDTVGQVNSLINTIFELNKQIVPIEGANVENANDLRDLRNAALDELAGLVNISYTEEINGAVTVKIEGVPAVGQSFAYEMGYETDKITGFVTPTWPMFKDMPVYDLTQEIAMSMETDVGKLKGLLLQRGDKAADYTDIPVKSDFQNADGTWASGTWEVDGETYNHGKDAYAAASEYYNSNINMSGLMNTMAEFDQLINGIVTAVNDILCPNTSMTVNGTEGWVDENGRPLAAGDYTVLDLANCTKGADGTVGTELFSRGAVERYTKYTYIDAAGKEQVCYVYNEPDLADKNTLYSIENLELNPVFKDNVGKFPSYSQNDEVAYKMAEKLYTIWSGKFATLNPNSEDKATFEEYFDKLINEIGNVGSVYGALAQGAADSAGKADNDRQMVIGVSSDEELSNMIKFQNAYNASSRYINVVSEMLEHIITQLGS